MDLSLKIVVKYTFFYIFFIIFILFCILCIFYTSFSTLEKKDTNPNNEKKVISVYTHHYKN